MPLYDYDCAACGGRFEVIHGVHGDPPLTCLLCGGGPVKKAFAAPAIHFKGSGWAKKERRSGTKAGARTTDGGASESDSGGSESDGTSSASEAAAAASKDAKATASRDGSKGSTAVTKQPRDPSPAATSSSRTGD